MKDVNFRKVRFVTSADSFTRHLEKELPIILMVGRSNVGKSTLINGLIGQNLAFSSKKAGKTKLLNYFLIDDTFYLLDSPGYGSTSYATMSTIHFSKMMEEGLKRPDLKAICLLLDFRRDPGEDDKAFFQYLRASGKPIIAILTKTDRMNQSEKAKARKIAKDNGFDLYIESELSGKTNDKIRKAILSYV